MVYLIFGELLFLLAGVPALRGRKGSVAVIVLSVLLGVLTWPLILAKAFRS